MKLQNNCTCLRSLSNEAGIEGFNQLPICGCMQSYQLTVEVATVQQRFAGFKRHCRPRLAVQLHLILEKVAKVPFQQELEESFGHVVQYC